MKLDAVCFCSRTCYPSWVILCHGRKGTKELVDGMKEKNKGVNDSAETNLAPLCT